MSLEDIEQKKIDRRNALKVILKDRETIEIKLLELSREILNLQIKKKDLQIPLEKAKTLEKELRLEIRNLEELFWSVKNS